MRCNLKFIVLFSLTVTSCADSSHNGTSLSKTYQGDTSLNSGSTQRILTASATNVPDNDTIIVDRKAAVFIEPDSLQVEERKRQVGEEKFFMGAGDYLYYMNTAHEFLDSVKLKIIIAKGKRFIKFIHSDKAQQLISLDKLEELWSIYFFDPRKKAMQIDMTIIDEEYKSYFK